DRFGPVASLVKHMKGLSDCDELTMEKCAANRGHLADLFDREFDAVYRFCLARTGDSAAADDAVSDAFMAAARLFASGRDHEVTRPWLFVVAKNRMVDEWRSHQRQRQRIQRLVEQRQTGGEDHDPLGVSVLADEVLAVLASMPERQRAVLALRYLDEHSVSEVASNLDVTYQAAESLLARARRSFATAWGQHHVQ
ncbi:MAG: sigma-70 family RNA polymerase sigma factor, partial [Acidimicrobiales bacterium]